MKKKLKVTAAAGGVLVLGLALGSCGGAEEPEGTTPPPVATEAPTTPTEPPVEHFDPPAPQPEQWEPELDLETEDPWGGLLTEEELEENFLETVRLEPVPPGIRALDDGTLLEYGATVCPAVEAGATFEDFQFSGLDPYLEAPVIAGAAVVTWCPDLIDAAMGTAYGYGAEV